MYKHNASTHLCEHAQCLVFAMYTTVRILHPFFHNSVGRDQRREELDKHVVTDSVQHGFTLE